ncbi:histidine phosphatase family protein [Sphingomonas aliaeris]|uniref:Histidine phosphatase family protein n=1 Tax=Sphingomonas aliaeris TaxID=2759526 RepID=A0A974NTE6_9SPHN|nr:histidine phosphatase family protein [Sphingomonas aliaeris]
MSVSILLIRHAPHGQLGETLSGRTPGVLLGEVGLVLADRLAERLSGHAIDRVQASPLDRTMQTARPIAQACGCAVEPVEALNEVDFGDWSGHTFAELSRDPLWSRWNHVRSQVTPPGGEPMADAQSRIVSHMQETAQANDGATIAMVTHCDMIRAAVARVLGLSLDNLLRFDVDPGSITHVVIDESGARLAGLNERPAL